eukprot:TRINITY_DN8971_c0_g2_i1.p1 TRINITY_DN8971_c0_g2~~TRINITY_DN8971_c0_g2_i1.p1  ORF type:complete len:578 (-),score=101.52 TRINITY_DN8971_c0_g2_i1:50-1720(-)
MSSFSIQSESDDHLGPVELSGTLLVGRGHLFKVTHKSVSRNHAELIVDSVANILHVKSVHSNPTFVYKVGSDKTVVLNKGEKIELCHDDKFSLLPKEIFFRVINPPKHLSTDQTLCLSPKLDGSSSTQELDLDPLENFGDPTDISDTSFLPSQNLELESSETLDIDPLETVKITTDNTDTLYLPSDYVEPNDTQELDIDPLETVKITTDNTETLYLPSDYVEPNDTQELDIDPLETVKITTDNTETLYLPSDYVEPNDTQELDIDPLETIKITTDNTDTLFLPSDVGKTIFPDAVAETTAKPSSSLTKESVLDANSCSSDSFVATEGSVTHKKRKLPVWMLEETKIKSPMKKVKSKTEDLIVTKFPDDVCKPDGLPTAPVVSFTLAPDTTKPDTTSRPVPDISTLPTTSTSVLPGCPYGTDCYRKNPAHLAKYSHPLPSAKGESKVCPYGSSCYRKNPDHFKEFSHPTKASHTRDKKPRSAKAKKRSVLVGTSDDDGEENCYNLKDDFIDDDGTSDESASTEVETSESEEWQPADDVTDLLEEANQFVKNPKMLRK